MCIQSVFDLLRYIHIQYQSLYYVSCLFAFPWSNSAPDLCKTSGPEMTSSFKICTLTRNPTWRTSSSGKIHQHRKQTLERRWEWTKMEEHEGRKQHAFPMWSLKVNDTSISGGKGRPGRLVRKYSKMEIQARGSVGVFFSLRICVVIPYPHLSNYWGQKW